MLDREHSHYLRIERAIQYLKMHFKEQPPLNDVAAAIGVSPFHFQRMFTDWAGVSPKKFIQYLSLEHAKTLLRDENTTLLETALKTGLSGTGRLHDLFINIEAMTPGEFKNGGENLTINYNFAESPFGKILIASTTKGICQLFFEESEALATEELLQCFPEASYRQQTDKFQQDALRVFKNNWQQIDQIKLHLNGSRFQLKVWEALLTIPPSRLTSYGSIAKAIKKPTASRAVGTAIGRNPVAFLIPCHRVIQSSGHIGGYKWGSTRKSAIIGWEAAQSETKAGT